MKIPLVDLQIQYRNLKPEIDRAVIRVMERGDFVLGEDLAQFEKSFAEFCRTKHAVGVASGLDALTLSLKALGVRAGDEVITAANTFVATTLAIVLTGAKPVLTDCHTETYNIDPTRIEERITPRTRVILPVHLYGQAAEMDPIIRLAEKYRLQIVEDACQAHGTLYRGRAGGSMGEIGCFSFYPGKNLGAYGDGGCVVTNSDELAEKLKLLRNYGSKVKYYHQEKGCNSRLDTIQAAVLDIKLKYLKEWNEKRRQAARRYDEMLRDRIPEAVTPLVKDWASSVFHLYVVRVPQRDAVLKRLHQRGVGAGIHYPIPVHLLDCHQDLGYRRGDFPTAEKYAQEILSLPIFPEITPEQIEYTVSALRSALDSLSSPIHQA